MKGNLSRVGLQSVPVLALAVHLHLLLLCAPLLLLSDIDAMTGRPHLAAFLVLISTWCVVEASVSHSGTHGIRTAAGPRWLPVAIGLVLLVTFWITLVDGALFARRTPMVAAVTGAVLMGTGIALRCLAVRRLGVFFLNEVAVLPGQPLVTSGIYGAMRHPSETGTLCLAVGGAIMLGSLPGLAACTLLLFPCLLWRTRLEDRVLRRRYPADFQRYATEVPAFLPGFRLTAARRVHPASSGKHAVRPMSLRDIRE